MIYGATPNLDIPPDGFDVIVKNKIVQKQRQEDSCVKIQSCYQSSTACYMGIHNHFNETGHFNTLSGLELK